MLLVQRRFPPLAGEWSLPGGAVDVGETLHECVVREMREETGLDVEVGAVIEVFDRIMRDEDRRVRYHFVLIDYLCWPASGSLQAGSDVEEAIWANPATLGDYALTEKATSVIVRGLTLAREAPRPVR